MLYVGDVTANTPVALMDNATEETRDNEETRTIDQVTGGPIEHRGSLADLIQRRRNIMREAAKLNNYKMGFAMNTYLVPIICCPGLIGNTLSALVMFQKHNRKISSCIYHGVLAFLDSVTLLTSLGLFITDNILAVYENATECTIAKYMRTWAVIASAWLIVAMTADRLYVVWKPLKAAQICTPRRAKMFIGFIIISGGALKIPLAMKYLIMIPLNGQDTCILAATRNTPLHELYYWINLLFSTYIPLCLVMVLNSTIIYLIRIRPKFSQSDAQIPNTVQLKKKEEDFQITFSLLLVSFVFLLLAAPMYLIDIVYQIKNPFLSPESYANFILAINIGGRVYLTNSAVNIFVYGVSGQKFRNDFKKLFCFPKKPTVKI